jgi:hypothetical protein
MRLILLFLLSGAMLGCAAKSPKQPASPRIIVPRECMGQAEFYEGQCEQINKDQARCKGVDMVLPIYCIRNQKPA